MNGTVLVGFGNIQAIDSLTAGKIEIPETVINGDKTYTVVAIADEAFAMCVGLTSTGLENNGTVKSIRAGAFYKCNNLDDIIFQQYTLPSIARSAFLDTNVNIYYLPELTNPEELDDSQAASVTKLDVKNINVKTAPTKTVYQVGEIFDPTGLVLDVDYDKIVKERAYSDSQIKDLFSFSKTAPLTTSDTSITITYNGKTTTQSITVKKAIKDIAINTKPTKQSYIEGESFDPKGLVLIVNYNNGSQETVTYNDTTKADFTFDKEVLGLNDRQVVITYKEKTVTQDITVEKKAIKPETGDNTYIGISIMMLVISMFVINAKRKKEIK